MNIKFTCTGHKNITSKHEKTFMFTTEDYLTPSGDCIIGINCTKSLSDISSKIKEKMRDSETKIKIELTSCDIIDTIIAYGNPKLTFTDNKDFVIRKSNFICPRTFAISANKSAKDLNRDLIQKLKEGEKLTVKITFF